MARTGRLLRGLSLGVALVALAAVGLTRSPADLVALAAWSDRHWLLLLPALGLLYVLRPFLLWPVTLFSVFVGFAFGVPRGLPVALAGTVVTCLPPFLLARRLGARSERVDWLGDRARALADATGDLRGVVAARLSPVPADAVSYGLGLADVSTGHFVLGTLLGELPWATFYVALGSSLRTLSPGAVGRPDPTLLVLAGLAAAALVARPVYGVVRGATDEWLDPE